MTGSKCAFFPLESSTPAHMLTWKPRPARIQRSDCNRSASGSFRTPRHGRNLASVWAKNFNC